MKKKYTTTINPTITDTGHKILLTLLLYKSKSFNELRNPPHKFNPKTLSKQLTQLETKGLIIKTPKTVRGGTQNRYTLTTTGEKWLENPLNITRATYNTILTMMIQQMQLHPKIKPQLIAQDLLQGKKIPHTLNLQTTLIIKSQEIQTNITWEMDQKGNLKIINIE
jgi:DNA-binding HxlR family transcriptional regulator